MLALRISYTISHVSYLLNRFYQSFSPSSRHMFPFRSKASSYSDELIAPRPTPQLEDHTLSAVRDCLINIITATLHIGGHSSIRNLRTRHAVVPGTHLSWCPTPLRILNNDFNCKNLCLNPKTIPDLRLVSRTEVHVVAIYCGKIANMNIVQLFFTVLKQII
jgi:hypothetical protein